MKFMFVGNTSWTMWNFRGDVMLSLKAAGHDVVVVAPPDAGHEILRENFQFEEIKSLKRKGENPIDDLLLFLELLFIYRRIRPDLIFHYTVKPNIYGGIAAFICGIKSCLVVAGLGFSFGRESWLKRVVINLYRLAAACSARVIFLNQDDFEDFKRFKIIVDSDKAILFPGEGVNMLQFAPETNQRDPKIGMRFIFIGRLLIDKGIRDFLNAARKLRIAYPYVQFQVLGPIDSGNPTAISFDELDLYIKDGSIEYLGEKTDVRPYLRDADALVLPTRYGEGLSRVILEAMAMEKPVIATDNRGCRMLVVEGLTGLVLPEKRVCDLPHVLQRFISLNDAERALMGQNGRKLVKREFSMSKLISLYGSLIGDVLPDSKEDRLAYFERR